MNRRQFLSLLPAAAVAGTATAAAAAAPKSLSLEEGLLSAWRAAPVSSIWIGGGSNLEEAKEKCRYVKLYQHWDGREWLVNMLYYKKDQVPDRQALKRGGKAVTEILDTSPYAVVSIKTEQGPMRLCPHSLRWFPYSPKTAAI